MSKIYGNAETIKQAKDAKPGDKSVYINWDAIAELPDQYEVIITEVPFNITKLDESFSDVGNGNYMPSPALHYKIAEARGISGGGNSLTNPIYEEVNISEMNRVDTPNFVKMLTGYQVSKFSTVMEEDGTERRSSACTIPYNTWNRCCELWSKEEETTEGYKGNLEKYPIVRGKKSWDLYPKYNTKWKRKKHFYEELKFAQQKAETKAHEKTIRELAGLMTGYKKEDLASGRLIFAKVRRSRKSLQLEQAAHLNNIEKGNTGENAQKVLFGPNGGSMEVVGDQEPEPEKQPEAPPEKTNREKLIEAFEYYLNDKDTELSEADRDNAAKTLEWIKGNTEAEQHQFWSKAIKNLASIENALPDFARFNHGLVLTD